MKRTDIWMPFYIGDYLADTAHLSARQHGAYLLLILHYWRTRKPLVTDVTRLLNVCSLSVTEWEVDGPVILEFFEKTNEGYFHKRIDQELARTTRSREQKSNAGKASAEKRWGGKGVTDVITDVVTDPITKPQRNSNELGNKSPSQSYINNTPIVPTENSPSPRKYSAQQYAPEFESFWKAYPRKVAKGNAYKAWMKQKPPLDACLSSLEWQKKSDQWLKENGQYIPHPASWINAKRWEDEPIRKEHASRVIRLAY